MVGFLHCVRIFIAKPMKSHNDQLKFWIHHYSFFIFYPPTSPIDLHVTKCNVHPPWTTAKAALAFPNLSDFSCLHFTWILHSSVRSSLVAFEKERAWFGAEEILISYWRSLILTEHATFFNLGQDSGKMLADPNFEVFLVSLESVSQHVHSW